MSDPIPMPAATAEPRSASFARINLLPERARLRLNERRRAVAWTLVNAMAAVAGLIAWQVCAGAMVHVVEARSQVGEQLARVRREERIGASLHSRLTMLQRQLATLDTLRPADLWATRLTGLAAAVPDETILTQITVPPPTAAIQAATPPPNAKSVPAPRPVETQTFTIAGYAATHARLAELLRRLEEADVDGVRLVRSAAAGNAAGALVQFEISATR